MRTHISTGSALVIAILGLGSTQAAACDWGDCDACGYGNYGNYGASAYSYYAPPVYFARPAFAAYAPVYYAPPPYYAVPAYYAAPAYAPPAYAPPAYGYRGYSRPYYGAGAGYVAAANADPRTNKILAARQGARGLIASGPRYDRGSNKALTAADGSRGVSLYVANRAGPGSRTPTANPNAWRIDASAASRPSRGDVRAPAVAKDPRIIATPAAKGAQTGASIRAAKKPPSRQRNYVSAAYYGAPTAYYGAPGGYLGPRR